MTLTEKILRGTYDPSWALSTLWRRIPLGSIELRCKFDALYRPQYAYGMIKAAKLSKALKIDKMSVIEFGVAEGNGLLEMERYASEVSRLLGLEIQIYGFDVATGLPPPEDWRDMPYHWNYQSKIRDFRMDEKTLRAKLTRSELILGDVKETVKVFCEKYRPAPIGFVAFDLDLYSSTHAALAIFDVDQANLLPRVVSYFDDTIADQQELYNECTGELLAIKEFNESHPDAKICKINGLYSTRYHKSAWSDAMYVMHSFKHALYSSDIRSPGYPAKRKNDQ
jgi:hypothetical protein